MPTIWGRRFGSPTENVSCPCAESGRPTICARVPVPVSCISMRQSGSDCAAARGVFHQDDVAVGDLDLVGRHGDEQTACIGVGPGGRDGRQEVAAVRRQARRRRAGDRHVGVDGNERHQRRGDVVHALLGPGELRGRLIHRQQRCGDRQERTEQTRHHRDETHDPQASRGRRRCRRSLGGGHGPSPGILRCGGRVAVGRAGAHESSDLTTRSEPSRVHPHRFCSPRVAFASGASGDNDVSRSSEPQSRYQSSRR